MGLRFGEFIESMLGKLLIELTLGLCNDDFWATDILTFALDQELRIVISWTRSWVVHWNALWWLIVCTLYILIICLIINTLCLVQVQLRSWCFWNFRHFWSRTERGEYRCLAMGLSLGNFNGCLSCLTSLWSLCEHLHWACILLLLRLRCWIVLLIPWFCCLWPHITRCKFRIHKGPIVHGLEE